MSTLKIGAVLAIAIAAGLSMHPGGAAESVAGQQIMKPGGRASIPADAKFFTGNARVERLFAATADLAAAGEFADRALEFLPSTHDSNSPLRPENLAIIRAGSL